MKTNLKRPYEKPSMHVYQISMCRLICNSGGNNPNWWNEPGNGNQI